ncbi:esterase/lipase family protein [Bacillus sp. DJP31]|uniref:esterase/lipase family protein n=1 Tax=Bacillus sp. DJP31 TaxID=3409789 RepID=UPI003BB7322F
MFKKSFIALVTVFFLLPSFSQAGSFGKDDPSGIPGQWYVGTTPSYVAPAKHPVLFVHGLNSSSNTWWNENNMYDTAYQNGYETAFVDLYPTKNMWDNGYLLSQKIRDMYNYFGEKVVVVAHSKGGIDTQSALVHYGASPYVARVVTLSTPHYGSQLADLAYSSWAGWLTGILGSKNDATYSLQTGYMNYFRSQTDNHSNARLNHFYTFGGTKWGSFGSSLYWGGLYLKGYGTNDGAVTVNSSKLSYGTQLSVGTWNHSTIKEGSTTFNLFKNYLNEIPYSSSSFLAQSMEPVSINETVGSFIRGGEFKGKKLESIHVEEGVNEITIDWMSATPSTELTLKDPTNISQASFTPEKDTTEYLNGAYHHTVTITNPASGEWIVEAKSKKNEHYLLHVTFDSPLNETIRTNLVNDDITFEVNDKNLKMTTEMTIEYYKNGMLKQGKVKVSKNGESYKLPKLGEGVYNMTIEVDGKQNQSKFERTIIKTVYIDAAGNIFHQ